MAVILAVLKLIGILLLVVLGLVLVVCAAVLFLPIRYIVECKNGERFNLGFNLSWCFRALQLRKRLSEQRINIYIFGINMNQFKNPFKKREHDEEDVHVTNSKVDLVDDFYEEEKNYQNAVNEEEKNMKIETDYEDESAREEEKVSDDHKKSFSFDKISSIITFIRDYENKSALNKIKKELAGLFRYLLPDRVRGKISFGTGDPCTTGWVLGAVSMIPAAYADGLTIQPDFEEKVFQADGAIKGKVRVIYFLRLFLRGYLDDEIKRCITKALKMI
ncbi:MAG: DUF2953 domain-containing protein [Roseburia sp.]|nr:DUF2953 domain-containing protein [Roseburia sp.]